RREENPRDPEGGGTLPGEKAYDRTVSKWRCTGISIHSAATALVIIENDDLTSSERIPNHPPHGKLSSLTSHHSIRGHANPIPRKEDPPPTHFELAAIVARRTRTCREPLQQLALSSACRGADRVNPPEATCLHPFGR